MRAQLSVVLSIAGLTLFACGDDDKGPRVLGGRCGSSEDCQPGLLCEFNYCHQPCSADRDCPSTARCVSGVAREDSGSAARVCQLPDDTTCESAVECRGKQICAAGECRDTCESRSGCASDQVCAKQKVCASTDPSKDRIDSAGNVVPDGTTVMSMDASNMSSADAATDAR